MLLRPTNSMESYCKSVKLNIDDTKPTEYFVCNNMFECQYKSPVLLSNFGNNRCTCGRTLEKSTAPEISDVFDGFVKNCNASFLISDELKVLPNSLDTFFSLLKMCNKRHDFGEWNDCDCDCN